VRGRDDAATFVTIIAAARCEKMYSALFAFDCAVIIANVILFFSTQSLSDPPFLAVI
jgi:hypothetical protein